MDQIATASPYLMGLGVVASLMYLQYFTKRYLKVNKSPQTIDGVKKSEHGYGRKKRVGPSASESLDHKLGTLHPSILGDAASTIDPKKHLLKQ